MSGTLTVTGPRIGIEMPADIARLDSFREWVRTLGEDGPRVHYSNGNVLVDMSPQDLGNHLPVISSINSALVQLSRQMDAGEYYADGAWLTNEEADLSTEPDGLYILWQTFRSGEVRFEPRKTGEGSIEFTGRGDMVLEVVSDSSEAKDLVDLVRDYARAGFHEYWIVDARRGALVFRILVLDAGSYREVEPDAGGWLRSPVWGRAFRLVRTTNAIGEPRYDLEVRE
ncbi:MAG: Uma2 family endonuclease [Planctomycetes bacterium]|nr:Uma2 family endonuclease [Planctomycetota bacterium]